MGDAAEVGTRSSDRRAFLRRAGLVTGGVWAAPVIQSLTTPAYAGSDQPCGASYWFSFSRGASPSRLVTEVLTHGPTPPTTGTCLPPGFTSAGSGVTPDGSSSRNGTFGTGALSGSFAIGLEGSTLSVSLSSGCTLRATVESGGTCSDLVRTSAGVYSAQVSDAFSLQMDAVICC